MNNAAGFIVKSKGQYLIAHTTQLLSKPDVNDGKWTISKGSIEPGETELQAAIRELKEETNLDLVKFYKINPNAYWFNKFHNRKRKITVFLVEDTNGILLKQPLKCNSMVANHPDTRFNGIPELDAFAWVTREEAYRMVFSSQKHLFAMEYIYANN
jgi:8-oxo-dGTP pyrophosphatase MutT (NUDIX family)